MKIVQLNVAPILGEFDSDHEIILNIDCVGAAQAGSAQIRGPETYRTIVIGKWIDASNFGINLPIPFQVGWVIEVYADGGTIEIFPGYNAGFSPLTFLDGSSSVSTSTGAKFRSLFSPTANANLWAKLD